MSPRKFAAYVALVAIAAALIALLWSVKLDAVEPMSRQPVTCGNSIATKFDQAQTADDHVALGLRLYDLDQSSNFVQQCKDRVNTRRMWAIPLGVVGIIVFAGALVIRTQERRTSNETVDSED